MPVIHALMALSILGHSDVAPRHKQGPGHLSPWETLAREGLGMWPSGIILTPGKESGV